VSIGIVLNKAGELLDELEQASGFQYLSLVTNHETVQLAMYETVKQWDEKARCLEQAKQP